jgi:hypothetical protein
MWGGAPFGYTPLGDEVGHTCQAILDGTVEQPVLSNETLHSIVKTLGQHPVIQQSSLNLLILLMISSQALAVCQRRQHNCNRGEESLTTRHVPKT